MSKIDARGRLDAEPYQFQEIGAAVRITHEGRIAATLRGDPARRFLLAIETADTRAAQLLMARATGNFKRGNERG